MLDRTKGRLIDVNIRIGTRTRRILWASPIHLILLLVASILGTTSTLAWVGTDERPIPNSVGEQPLEEALAPPLQPGVTIDPNKLSELAVARPELRSTAATGDELSRLSLDIARIVDAEENALGEFVRELVHHTPRMTYVHFRQVVDGAALHGSRLTLQWDRAGRFVRSSGQLFPETPSSPESGWWPDVEFARDLASDGRSVDNWILEERVWLPESLADGTTRWVPAWRLRFTHADHGYEAWIDEGGLLGREDQTRHATIDGTVLGAIEERSPWDTPVTLPLTSHQVEVHGDGAPQTTFTDSEGRFSFEVVSSSTVTVRFPLAGRSARILDASGASIYAPVDSLQTTAPSELAFIWNDENSTASQRDAYLHTDEAYRFARALDPGPSLEPLDDGIEVRVDDRSGVCNAQFDGTRLTFFSGNNDCVQSARIADAVYHEYGHAVTHHIYSPFSARRDMDEGWSDYFAATQVNSPLVGSGWTGPDTFLREIETDRVWPDDASLSPHTQGLILAGALWDLRESLGPEVVDPLFHFPRYALATNFDEYLVDILVYDDDDGNLANGSPHFSEIIEAFSAHGIGDYSVNIDPPPMYDLELLGAEVALTARIDALLGLDPESVAFAYRLEGDSSFQRVPLEPTETPYEYRGSFSTPEVQSRIEYYWEAADTSGHSATFPLGAPESHLTFFVGPDISPPTITHTPIEFVTSDREYLDLVASVIDNSGTIGSVTARIERENGSELGRVEMTSSAKAGAFVGQFALDSPASGESFHYSLTARDAATVENSRTIPSEGRFRAEVRDGTSSTFESGDAGLRPSGDWAWGQPLDIEPTSGANVWATNLNGDYSLSTTSTLVFGPIDLAHFESARLQFSHVYDFLDGFHGGRVEASSNETTWRVIDPMRGYPESSVSVFTGRGYSAASAGWEEATFALDDYLGGPLWIRWVMSSDDSGQRPGWYLDDLVVVAAQARANPTFINARSGESEQVLLTWRPPRGVDTDSDRFLGYRIYRAHGDGPFDTSPIHIEPILGEEYLDTGLINERGYRYRVHALYGEGESLGSEVTATPAAPSMRFEVEDVTFTLSGTAASDTTFFVRNLGNGTLDFDVFVAESDWALEQTRTRFEVPKGEEPIVAIQDEEDAFGNPDLERIEVRRWNDDTNGDMLEFSLHGYANWDRPTEAWGGLLLIDTDSNLASRPKDFAFDWGQDLNLGMEYAVVFGRLARDLGTAADALLYEVERDFSTPLTETNFPENGREISFSIPLDAIRGAQTLQIQLLFSRNSNATPFEWAPEIPKVEWLQREPRHGRARLGQPQPFSLEFDGSRLGNGTFAAKVFLETNDPLQSILEIPVTLVVRGVVPNELDGTSFRSTQDGVAIEVILPRGLVTLATQIERKPPDGGWSRIHEGVPDENRVLSYLDRTAVPSTEYEYRFRALFDLPEGQETTIFGPYEVLFAPVVPEEMQWALVGANPFRFETAARLSLPIAGPVRVGVFDLSGRRVRQLHDGDLPAGFHLFEWNGRSDQDEQVPSGRFWLQVTTPRGATTLRLVHIH